MNAHILFILILLNAAIVKYAYATDPAWYYALLISIPILLLSRRTGIRQCREQYDKEAGNHSPSMLQRIRNYFL